jgi:hypothetical protein
MNWNDPDEFEGNYIDNYLAGLPVFPSCTARFNLLLNLVFTRV